MRKICVFSVVVLFSLGFVSCEKDCTCNYVSEAIDITPDGEWEDLLDMYNSKATLTESTKGDCSDLDAVATSTKIGIQITETLTCIKK